MGSSEHIWTQKVSVKTTNVNTISYPRVISEMSGARYFTNWMHLDASSYRIGAVLLQAEGKLLKPLT